MPASENKKKYIKRWQEQEPYRNAWYQFNAELKKRGYQQCSLRQYQIWKADKELNTETRLKKRVWDIVAAGDYEKKHAL